ncbi:unnamed protein product [Heligmosomoides polygyrus]|uniref:Uncharacterized protein n=1 Tax=Heligmosomoides polygyrus TaxID=6339 RepID=A0A183GK95_HELPZ|nr:unnamed protein product [Heligmosomoides polygyrus]
MGTIYHYYIIELVARAVDDEVYLTQRLNPEEDPLRAQQESGVRRDDTVVSWRAAAFRIQHGLLLQQRKRSLLLLDTAGIARVSERPDFKYVSLTSHAVSIVVVENGRKGNFQGGPVAVFMNPR